MSFSHSHPHCLFFRTDRGCTRRNEKLFFESISEHFEIEVYCNDSSKTSSTRTTKTCDVIEYFDEAIYICKLERRSIDKHEPGNSSMTKPNKQ